MTSPDAGKDIDTENKGHPPSAVGRLMIDFDATIVPWGTGLMEKRYAFPGVRNAINQLHSEGFQIVVFTSRVSPTWCAAAGTTVTEQYEYVRRTLIENGIAWNGITAEKVPAEAYFDDKAFNVPAGQLASVLAVWRINR